MEQINREWLKYIDTSLIDIFPIQFANCDRLQKNDAVYIFDEVGSGKTVSSGLMAIDYLCSNPGERVLVISTNVLVKRGTVSEYGQFLSDWYNKLPFKQLGLEDRIDIVNNHCSNFSTQKKYGLVIIDEAQLFLNTESLRYRWLSENIRAEKIVFLTATPIKSSIEDLTVYLRLAEDITNKKLPSDWIEEINTCEKNPEDIICSMFNSEFPVTRYFKDTIMSLNVEGFKKRQARRLSPQIWMYGAGETKDEVLLKTISEKLDEDENNRFVVFTRLVDNEAKNIGDMLSNAGFIPYIEGREYSDESRTFKVVTGENSYELSAYSRTANLPTVLILTYQIAEQGVNLPGYNHVVNYHISAFPSALEQRFGRIDRMGKSGSIFPEINMCFLISQGCCDTNTWNFYCAVDIYIHSLISYLPSKNTILSKDIITAFLDIRDAIEAYVSKIRELLTQDRQMEAIVRYFQCIDGGDSDDRNNFVCDCDPELFELIVDNEKDIELVDDEGTKLDISLEPEKAKAIIVRYIKKILSDKSRGLGRDEEFDSEKYSRLIDEVSDKIFYSEDPWGRSIKTVDAIYCGECISKTESFRLYSDEFKEYVKVPILVSNHSAYANSFFEKLFFENDFRKLFPGDGYCDIFKEIVDGLELSDEDKQLIIDNADIIVKMLPVYKIFDWYGSILQRYMYTNLGVIRTRFDFNPLKCAFLSIYLMIRNDDNHLGLSEEFFTQYFAYPYDEVCREYPDRRLYDRRIYEDVIYRIGYDKQAGIIQATNWYKLAYQYTKEDVSRYLMKRGFKSCNWEQSLFNYYFCNDSGREREHAMTIYVPYEYTGFDDEWTAGIRHFGQR